MIDRNEIIEVLSRYAPDLLDIATEFLEMEDAWAAIDHDAKAGVPEARAILSDTEKKYDRKRQELLEVIKGFMGDAEEKIIREDADTVLEVLLNSVATTVPEGGARREVQIMSIGKDLLELNEELEEIKEKGGVREGKEQQRLSALIKAVMNARTALEQFITRDLITAQEERGQELDERTLRILLPLEVDKALGEVSKETGIPYQSPQQGIFRS